MVRVVDDSEVEAVFAEGGPLSSLVPGYRPRRQQIDMALQVAKALRTPRGRLVVEAGTGTGKSFAYLVPALLSEGRVVVATGTRNLQDQLVDKDAPLAVQAVAALRGDKKITQHVMRMKGRNNYLCKLRFEQFDRQRSFGFTEDVLVQIGKFAQTTKTGDRAELKGLPDHLPLWSEIDADKDHCLFQACPVYDQCYVVEMRRAAEKASVVVVNHHLLCADQRIRLDSAGFDDGADFGGVLPTFDALIVDEAHALPDVATDHFGMETGTEVLARLSADVRRNADQCSGDDRAALLDAADDVDAAAGLLFAAVAGGRTASGGKGRVDRTLFRASTAIAEQSHAAGEALKRLSGVLEATATQQIDQTDLDEQMHKAKMAALHRRADLLRAELTYLTTAAPADDRYVLFVDVGARSTSITAAPIDVSSPLSGTVFKNNAPVILTSATLAVGTDVRPFLFSIGLAADAQDGVAEDTDVDTGIYASPFDYKERAALYAPADMPEPQDKDHVRHFDDEVLFLLALSKGGALLLFTSHRAMEEAVVRLQPGLATLDIPILKQGDRPKNVLLDELRASGRAALFATASFWEGVDVRGAALRLVIIDRLPFAVPSDPLVKARGEHARSRGKDPFNDIAVADAALALKQGVGRLLRTVDDAGVVAVLDGRLRKRSYGRIFLEALPPMTRVGARKTLAQFWMRFVEPALHLTPSPASSPAPPSSASAPPASSSSSSSEPS